MNVMPTDMDKIFNAVQNSHLSRNVYYGKMLTRTSFLNFFPNHNHNKFGDAPYVADYS